MRQIQTDEGRQHDAGGFEYPEETRFRGVWVIVALLVCLIGVGAWHWLRPSERELTEYLADSHYNSFGANWNSAQQATAYQLDTSDSYYYRTRAANFSSNIVIGGGVATVPPPPKLKTGIRRDTTGLGTQTYGTDNNLDTVWLRPGGENWGCASVAYVIADTVYIQARNGHSVVLKSRSNSVRTEGGFYVHYLGFGPETWTLRTGGFSEVTVKGISQ